MDGSIKLEDKDLTSFTENDYCKIRGNEVSMIFQEPMTSLNPVLTIGEQITEVLIYHKNMKKKKPINELLNSCRWSVSPGRSKL